MTKTLVRRSVLGGLVGVALLVLLVPIAKLATNNAEVFEACINPGNGMMRLVDASTSCHNNETRIEWNAEGPPGPPGPEGPEGPEGPPGPSSGGPPFVWICGPANRPNTISLLRSDIYVFNGSGAAADVSINLLDSTGNNLVGVAIPGVGGETYPGDAGAATVSVAASHTRNLHWTTPTTGGGGPGIDGVTNVVFQVRVTSNQPVVVGANFDGGSSFTTQCGLLPK